jgi:hypothetical protein
VISGTAIAHSLNRGCEASLEPNAVHGTIKLTKEVKKLTGLITLTTALPYPNGSVFTGDVAQLGRYSPEIYFT